MVEIRKVQRISERWGDGFLKVSSDARLLSSWDVFQQNSLRLDNFAYLYPGIIGASLGPWKSNKKQGGTYVFGAGRKGAT